MAFTVAQHKEYRAKMKAEGICVVCHKRKADGKSVCAVCSKRQTKRKDMYRADMTRCYDCQGKLDEFLVAIGERYCGCCRERRQVNRYRYYQKYRR